MRGGYEAVIVVVVWDRKKKFTRQKQISLMLVFTSAAVGMEPSNGSLTQNR